MSDLISRQDMVSRRRLLSDLKELITAWEKYPVMAEQIKGVEAAIGYVEAIPSAQSDVPDTNVGDTISRQAAIDALAKFVPYAICDESTESYTNGLTDAYNLICQLPSAQPKIGRWIHDGSKWTNRWICSECGYKWFFDCIEGAYCPNCGADMRGEQE